MPPMWEIFMVAIYCAGLLAYFPGNLGLLWPRTVEVEPRVGLRLVGPFKKLDIPIADVGDLENSPIWQGCVVHLTRTRGALSQFVIPWYFGSQRKDLIRAIQSAVSQSAS
jgi:hypothetical protein